MKLCLAALLFAAAASGASQRTEATPCILESEAGCEVTLAFTSAKDDAGVYRGNFLLSLERPEGFRGWVEFDVYHQYKGKWVQIGTGCVLPGDPQKSDHLLVTVSPNRTITLRVVVRIVGKGDVYPFETTVLSYRM